MAAPGTKGVVEREGTLSMGGPLQKKPNTTSHFRCTFKDTKNTSSKSYCKLIQKGFHDFQEAVVSYDIMVDKLIIKDVQLTSANDDNYFVFEDFILQVLGPNFWCHKVCH